MDTDRWMGWLKVEGWDNGRGGEGDLERGYEGSRGLAGGEANLRLRAKWVPPLTELDFLFLVLITNHLWTFITCHEHPTGVTLKLKVMASLYGRY